MRGRYKSSERTAARIIGELEEDGLAATGGGARATRTGAGHHCASAAVIAAQRCRNGHRRR